MSEAGDERDIKLPRETSALFGHAEAEQALLTSYKSGRLPHAWLIGGPHGIGKSTLAYRFARFILAHPDPAAPVVQGTTSLAVDPQHPVARHIAAQAQADLLVLERVMNEQTGKLYTVIRVDDVRRTVSFFGSTAGEGGWRIAIVDSVDELQREGANALLKILEEPPQRAILLLVSHAPGRELATIRSRCRRLLLRPLGEADVARAAAAAAGRSADDADVQEAARAADGSVARALMLLDEDARGLRLRVRELFAQLPDPDPRALHALGDALGGSDPQTLATFMDLVNGWLAERLGDGTRARPQLAALSTAWDKINRTATEVETYNLERKPFAFAVFGALAEAVRQ
jgi:DNA polymerase-3 subunit delta'